ncbi:hypothetical protein B0H13DRAFT_1977850 [Mycena leptocephala]|nr:hypothetical protein B0H13DRAFT_1977850 [Mycena leptocephala]
MNYLRLDGARRNQNYEPETMVRCSRAANQCGKLSSNDQRLNISEAIYTIRHEGRVFLSTLRLYPGSLLSLLTTFFSGMAPLPLYSRGTETGRTWALVTIIIPAVLLGVTFFLALRSKRVRRTKEDRLISTSTVHSESDGGDISQVDSDSDLACRHADARSVAYSATIRRRYLENELRRTQEQIVDIDSFTMRVSPTTSRMSLATMLGSPVGPGESNQEMAELLKAARDRNAMLSSRIEALESQMQSAWAQGLSDEPPRDTL